MIASTTLAVIGGSGITSLPGFSLVAEHRPDTRYGRASAAIAEVRQRGRTLLFLPRHGEGRSIAPHDINYRANIAALKAVGAGRIVAVSSVGGIAPAMAPGTLAVPDQIIDYTWGRAHTFFESALAPNDVEASSMHIDFTEPFDVALRRRLVAAAARAGVEIVPRGCYGATQGPRLETAAEIRRLERDGCDLVGMTGMPEAALAREAGLAYAQIAVVANRAPGKDTAELSADEIIARGEAAVPQVADIISALIDDL